MNWHIDLLATTAETTQLIMICSLTPLLFLGNGGFPFCWILNIGLGCQGHDSTKIRTRCTQCMILDKVVPVTLILTCYYQSAITNFITNAIMYILLDPTVLPLPTITLATVVLLV